MVDSPARLGLNGPPGHTASQLEASYERYRTRAYALIQSRPEFSAIPADQQEEIFHEAYASAWKRRNDPGIGDLDRYFNGAVIRQALMRLRWLARHPTCSLHESAPSAAGQPPGRAPAAESLSPEERVERQATAQLAREIVASLPRLRQALVMLRFGWELEPAEIQAALRISPDKYEKQLRAACEELFAKSEIARAGRWCEHVRSLLTAWVVGIASEAQERRAREHVRTCPACNQMVARLRGAAATVPLPPLLSATSSGGDRLLEELTQAAAEAKHQAVALVGRMTGADPTAPATQIAASGGARGAGGLAAGTLLKVCLGGAAAVGGGAYCVTQGVVPEPVRDLAGIERVEKKAQDRDADPTLATEVPTNPPATAAPTPPQESSRATSPERPPEAPPPAPTPGDATFENTAPAPPTSSSSSGAEPRRTAPPPASGGGGFRP